MRLFAAGGRIREGRICSPSCSRKFACVDQPATLLTCPLPTSPLQFVAWSASICRTECLSSPVPLPPLSRWNASLTCSTLLACSSSLWASIARPVDFFYITISVEPFAFRSRCKSTHRKSSTADGAGASSSSAGCPRRRRRPPPRPTRRRPIRPRPSGSKTPKWQTLRPRR